MNVKISCFDRKNNLNVTEHNRTASTSIHRYENDEIVAVQFFPEHIPALIEAMGILLKYANEKQFVDAEAQIGRLFDAIVRMHAYDDPNNNDAPRPAGQGEE